LEIIKLARPSPVQPDPEQPLDVIVDSMLAHELCSVPVLLNRKIVGILHLAAARQWTQQCENQLCRGLVKDVMLTNFICYKEGTKLEDALIESNSWFPAEDAQGNFAGIIMTSTLIVYLNKRLTTQSQRYQVILENLPNGIIAINAEDKIEIVNKATCRLLGVDKGIIGQSIGEVFPESNLPDITKSGLTQYGHKIEINGHTFISNRSPIICDTTISGSVAIFQDITELENISYKLASVKQLNLELDAIIESSYDGIAICDHEGRGIRINQAHARLTGLDASHFIGQPIDDLYEKGIFKNKSITIKALRERRTITSVQKISTSGKQVLVTSNPIFDSEGNVARVVNNVRDISELHELNEELRESKLLATRYKTELSQLMLERLKKNKIIVENPGMIKLLNLAIRTAPTDATVLLLGESGVGKEVLSRIIHNSSNRATKGSFIQINCGAIPENLLESELFGYEHGAFTGANPQGKPGMFELANFGTLLLDEIGDLSANLQVKLLRVLQEQEIYRLGGTKPIKLDVRIIAATNRNIWERVQEGTFREDLFYRLNVLPIEVPPLRERKEDILPLTMHFILLYNEKYGVKKRLDPKAIPLLEAYSWPGNVRELKNVLERLLLVTEEELIQPLQVQIQLSKFKTKFNSPITVNEILPIQQAKELLEKELIMMAFDCYPSIRKAAEVLGLDHSNVMRKAIKYGIKK